MNTSLEKELNYASFQFELCKFLKKTNEDCRSVFNDLRKSMLENKVEKVNGDFYTFNVTKSEVCYPKNFFCYTRVTEKLSKKNYTIPTYTYISYDIKFDNED